MFLSEKDSKSIYFLNIKGHLPIIILTIYLLGIGMNINASNITQVAAGNNKVNIPDSLQMASKKDSISASNEPEGRSIQKITTTSYMGGVDRAQMSEQEARVLTVEYTQKSDNAFHAIFDNTYDMRDDYTQVQIDLLNENPELMGKDWDFTIDAEGELLVVEGNDKLSEKEIKQITDILVDNNIDDHMSNLANAIVERGVGQRGPEQYQTDEGIGLYDVTRDTMPDILRGRELMDETKMRFVQTGTPEFLRAREAYDENRLSPLEAIFKQVSNRAEEKYNYDPNILIDSGK